MKLFKKIRLWLIKKLNAIPKEKNVGPVVTKYVIPYVNVQWTETLSYPYCRIEEYQGRVKNSIATRIGLALLENELIEFETADNFETMGITIRGRIKVAKPYVSGDER